MIFTMTKKDTRISATIRADTMATATNVRLKVRMSSLEINCRKDHPYQDLNASEWLELTLFASHVT